MKTFREFLEETEAPATVNSNVGKPIGGKQKEFKEIFKGVGDDLKKRLSKP